MTRILLAAVGGLLFLGLSNRDLWLPDEARDAEISREMSATGDLVVPRLNGEPFLEKPPLSYAAAALSLRLWPGRPETAVRIPSALFALGTLACTFWMGWRLKDAETGMLAAIILGTSWTFGKLSHTCLVDIGLWCFVALAMASALEALRTDRPGWWWVSAGAMGLAFLAKGPIGILMPALGIGTYLLATRKPAGWLKGIPWLPMVGVLAAVCALWLWPLHERGLLDGYVSEHRRRLGTGVEHDSPFWWYLWIFWEELLPWCALLPFALWMPRNRGLGFPLAWFLSTLVLLSIPQSKRGLYLVPAFPALALVLAASLPRRLVLGAASVLVLAWAGYLLAWMPRENDAKALAPHLGTENLAGYALSEPVRGAVAFSRGGLVPMLADRKAVSDWIAKGGVVLAPQGALEGFRVIREKRVKHDSLVWLGGKE